MTKSYEQQALDLTDEVEALKAQVNQLHEALVLSFNGAWDDNHAIDIDTQVRLALTSTSKQCLNSVKADAITDAANHAYAAGYKRPINFMHDYANKLRTNN